MADKMPWEEDWSSKPAEAKNPWDEDWSKAPDTPMAADELSASPLAGYQIDGEYTPSDSFLSNILPSAKKLAADTINPILTIDTTAKNVGRLVGGVAAKLGIGDMDQSMADAAGAMLAERYGGVDKVLKTAHDDPMGFASDLSALLTGGSMLAAKAPGLVGNFAKVAGKTAERIDPLSLAAKGLGKAGQGAGWVASHGSGIATGVGGDAIREYAASQRAGNKTAQEFMRGRGNYDDLGYDLESATRNIQEKANRQYQSDMATVSTDPTVLNFNGIDAAIQSGDDMTKFKGVSKDKAATDVVDDMRRDIEAWKQLTPADYHTPIGFDALKQSLYRHVEKTEPGTRAHSVASDIYHAVRDDIAKQAPDYNKAMLGYQNSKDFLGQVGAELSQNARSRGTTTRKIMSTGRSNVNTNFGYRRDLLKRAAEEGGQAHLPGAVAGALLSPVEPVGLARVLSLAGGGGAMALLGTPAGLGTLAGGLALSSPRIAGEVAGAVGKAQRALDHRPLSPAQLRLIRQTTTQLNRAEQEKKKRKYSTTP